MQPEFKLLKNLRPTLIGGICRHRPNNFTRLAHSRTLHWVEYIKWDTQPACTYNLARRPSVRWNLEHQQTKHPVLLYTSQCPILLWSNNFSGENANATRTLHTHTNWCLLCFLCRRRRRRATCLLLVHRTIFLVYESHSLPSSWVVYSLLQTTYNTFTHI